MDMQSIEVVFGTTEEYDEFTDWMNTDSSESPGAKKAREMMEKRREAHRKDDK